MKYMEELENKLIEYEREFEKIDSIAEDKKRVEEFRDLLKRYSEDPDILRLAQIYTVGSWNERKLERVSRITDLEGKIFHEILDHERGEKEFGSDREEVRYMLMGISDYVRNSKLLRPQMELKYKKYQVTAEDLAKRMTI